jgi:transmembrane sensor
MPNVVQFRLPQRSYEEAAAWIARLDRGCSSEDAERLRERLREWLQADARNRKAFLELAAVWDGLDVVSELSSLFPLDQPASKRRRPVVFALAAAAALGLAAAAVAFVQGVGFRSVPEPSALQAFEQDFETAVGGRESEPLADGSVVTLNTDTQVEVRYSRTSRDVYLIRGEANFEVAHDTAHPFNVHVGGRIVQAVGTAFNVRLEPDSDVEVTVTEGKVRVTRPLLDPPGADARRPGRSGRAAVPAEAFDATLVQGQLARLERPEGGRVEPLEIVQLEPVDLDIKLAWQRGILIFRGEPLEAMLSEVARYTTARFAIEDDSLRGVRVGGYFRAGDVDGLLLALRENFNIESERVGADRIVLRTVH